MPLTIESRQSRSMCDASLPVVSGRDVVKAFETLGWTVVRQSSSHIIDGSSEHNARPCPYLTIERGRQGYAQEIDPITANHDRSHEFMAALSIADIRSQTDP